MLAAAVATWLLTFAHDYPQFLLAALGVGIAGGSFAVGIAYVSRWYPTEKQGTALGIFGAGNVGAAVTKFCRALRHGRLRLADGRAGLGRRASPSWAIVFWFTTKDDPELSRAPRAAASKPRSAWLELEPLKNVQVWRFSLYYFFVFGAFVALALWLPRYLIGVYGLDIKTAGMIGAAYLGPGQPVPRLWRRSVRPLRRAPRHVLDVRRRRSLHASSSPIRRPTTSCRASTARSHFHLETGLVAFTVIVFVLGFFMSLGKAAVYKHIPVYYPKQCRLGRRPRRHDRRPRRLCAADRLRRAQRPHRRVDRAASCCCSLLVGGRAGLDACRDPAHGARASPAALCEAAASFPEMQAIHEAKHVGALSGRSARGLAAGGRGVLGQRRAARSPGAICGSRSRRCCCPSRSGWCGRWSSPSCRRSASSSPPTSCSGWRRCPASRARRCASSTPSWCRSSAGGCGPRFRPGR